MTASAVFKQATYIAGFITAGRRYWLGIYPQVRHEARQLHKRAQQIPDQALRRSALEAQYIKRGNVEGSAAFAAFAPRKHRRAVVRAQVSFQSIYDYVDTLAELPNTNPSQNARQLHRALLAALETRPAQTIDYYALHSHHDDGGYLTEIIDTCRTALATLPSLPAVRASAKRVTERIVIYQSLNLTETQGGQKRLAEWARTALPQGYGLHWWETAASAGSSLCLFALIAGAARPHLEASEATAIENAYWPWIGALHSLLDSLVDRDADTAADQRSLLDNYATPREAVCRLRALTREGMRVAKALPHARHHLLILGSMAAHYLTSPEAQALSATEATHNVLQELGPIVSPAMLVLQTRHLALRTTRHSRATDGLKGPS
jgi:tetraprenyl-beta-curcumene synthase